jgi:hypothetical protein
MEVVFIAYLIVLVQKYFFKTLSQSLSHLTDPETFGPLGYTSLVLYYREDRGTER